MGCPGEPVSGEWPGGAARGCPAQNPGERQRAGAAGETPGVAAAVSENLRRLAVRGGQLAGVSGRAAPNAGGRPPSATLVRGPRSRGAGVGTTSTRAELSAGGRTVGGCREEPRIGGTGGRMLASRLRVAGASSEGWCAGGAGSERRESARRAASAGEAKGWREYEGDRRNSSERACSTSPWK